MRRLLLVANPAASGFTAGLHRDVVEILERTHHVTAVWPNGPAEARSEATAAAEDEFDVVAAMGGDGVVHQVVNGIIGSATALGVVPAGTTNVVRRILRLPRKPRAAAEALAAAEGTRPLDTLSLTRELGEHTEEHAVAFAAGMGLDAEVIRESERRPLAKVGFGAVHYARSAVRVAAGYGRRPPTMRVRDGRRHADAVAVLFQVHEHFTYVGRLPLSLSAGPRPTAIILSHATIRRLAGLVVRSAGRLDLSGLPGVEVWNGFDEIEVLAEPPEWTEADGELLGRAGRIVVRPGSHHLLVADTRP
jgi:diacylglycerol kinase family enzyme